MRSNQTGVNMKKVKIEAKELIKEHKHLVKVLKSPSHKDDIIEARKQELELKEYQRKNHEAKKRK